TPAAAGSISPLAADAGAVSTPERDGLARRVWRALLTAAAARQTTLRPPIRRRTTCACSPPSPAAALLALRQLAAGELVWMYQEPSRLAATLAPSCPRDVRRDRKSVV